MSYLDDSVAQLTIFEGSIPWMYRDTNGFATVGVGQMLPNAASAQALAFVDATGAPATPDAILADFQRVQALASAMKASAYRTATSLVLPGSTISALLTAKVQEFDGTLSAKFANYATFPDPAKLGLLDMIFNLGPRGLFSGFPTFMGYVQRTDWANAALQCRRVGPSPARNAWTAAQFNAAAALQAPNGS
jgi:GH24 family phage-related lysozyme (muramidase)